MSINSSRSTFFRVVCCAQCRFLAGLTSYHLDALIRHDKISFKVDCSLGSREPNRLISIVFLNPLDDGIILTLLISSQTTEKTTNLANKFAAEFLCLVVSLHVPIRAVDRLV